MVGCPQVRSLRCSIDGAPQGFTEHQAERFSQSGRSISPSLRRGMEWVLGVHKLDVRGTHFPYLFRTQMSKEKMPSRRFSYRSTLNKTTLFHLRWMLRRFRCVQIFLKNVPSKPQVEKRTNNNNIVLIIVLINSVISAVAVAVYNS